MSHALDRGKTVNYNIRIEKGHLESILSMIAFETMKRIEQTVSFCTEENMVKWVVCSN